MHKGAEQGRDERASARTEAERAIRHGLPHNASARAAGQQEAKGRSSPPKRWDGKKNHHSRNNR